VAPISAIQAKQRHDGVRRSEGAAGAGSGKTKTLAHRVAPPMLLISVVGADEELNQSVDSG